MSNLINFFNRVESEATPEANTEPIVAVEEAEVVEPPAAEEVIENAEIIAEEPEAVVESEVEQVEVVEPKGNKLKVDYKQFLEDNKEVIKNYLNDSTTDYSKMSSLEAIKLKIKNENPEFDEEDIKSEIEDKYYLDLKDKDADYLDEDEIKLIKKGERLLKKDAKEAKAYLNSLKTSIESLPEFELDVEPQEPTVIKEEFDIESYNTKLQADLQKQKEEVWIPTLKESIKEVDTLTEEVEYEQSGNKGVIKVSYKLSDAEKEGVLNHLTDYISNPSDDKYINQDGSVNYKGFVEDKSKELYYSKLLKTVAKEAMAIGIEGFVSKDLKNFSEDVRNVAPTETSQSDYDFYRKIRGGK